MIFYLPKSDISYFLFITVPSAVRRPHPHFTESPHPMSKPEISAVKPSRSDRPHWFPSCVKTCIEPFIVLLSQADHFRIFLFLYEIVGCSLKIWRSRDWFWIKCHFVSKACFKFDTDGQYCVTKGKISFCVLFLVLFFPLSTEHLLVNLISDSSFSTKLRG